MTRVTTGSREPGSDVVAVEEPLEIRVGWPDGGESRERVISVTMRTPGDDFDLAAGFLFTERVISSAADIESVRHWGSPNQVRVGLHARVKVDVRSLERHFYTSSSCGVCGKTSVDAIRVALAPLNATAPSATVVHALPAALEHAQTGFRATGGLHGAAIVDRDGVVLCAREDIGRHNAVDKVIGSLIRAGQAPPSDSILLVSSRASFELVQKAVIARIPTLASIGGPSSLAIELAREFNLTLIGFLRDRRFNVYSGQVR